MSVPSAMLVSYGHAAVQPAVWVHPAALPIAYGVMVSLNAASFKYGRNATSTYTYTWAQPDPKTFSIWGLIYALQFIFCLVQLFVHRIRHDERVILARPAYVMSCLLNGSWLIVNAEANLGGLSSYWMAAFVLVAYVIYMYLGVFWYVAQDENPYKGALSSNTKAECETEKTQETSEKITGFLSWKRKLEYRFLVWYPVSTNLAWIVLAASLNVSSCLLDIEYLHSGQITAVGGPDWAIGIALVATLLAVHVSITKADLGYAFVTIWALLGIYRNQQPGSEFPHERSETLATLALLCIGLVAVAIVVGTISHLLPSFH